MEWFAVQWLIIDGMVLFILLGFMGISLRLFSPVLFLIATPTYAAMIVLERLLSWTTRGCPELFKFNLPRSFVLRFMMHIVGACCTAFLLDVVQELVAWVKPTGTVLSERDYAIFVQQAFSPSASALGCLAAAYVLSYLHRGASGCPINKLEQLPPASWFAKLL